MTGLIDLGGKLPPWLERAWLQRYLDRELTLAEVEAFEVYLLDKPHLVAEVEADTQLRAAVATDPGLLRGVRGTDTPPAVQESGSAYRSPAVWASMAAGVLLGVGAAWVGFNQRTDRVGVSAPPRVVFDTLRGELSAPREDKGDPSSPIRLYELPLPPGARLVAAEVLREGDSVPLPLADASVDGYLTYALPSSWRHSGELHLDIVFGGDVDRSARLTFPL